jgi:hypothetical protein
MGCLVTKEYHGHDHKPDASVAGHRDQMAARLERLDDSVFVLGEDAGESVRPLDGVGDRGRHVVGVHVRCPL